MKLEISLQSQRCFKTKSHLKKIVISNYVRLLFLVRLDRIIDKKIDFKGHLSHSPALESMVFMTFLIFLVYYIQHSMTELSYYLVCCNNHNQKTI